VSFAGLIDCEVKVREGSDRAAAQTLDDDDADEGGLEGPLGDEGEVMAWPFLGFCRCSWRALARAFSCVRTKYAKFWSRVNVCLVQSQALCLAPL
jgi:hypothetical protein